MAESVIELPDVGDRQAKPSNDAPDQETDGQLGSEFSLPPVDTGKQAWLFLAACWGVEAVTFGFGFSFGVFQDYYSNNAPFAGSGNIAAIGTTTTGIMYIGAPFVLVICRLYPRQARWFTLGGLTLSALGLATSSLCTSVPQLVGTQGVLYGVGGCIAYCPCTLYIDEWFVRRKGLAYGIVWSAAGAGGAVLPILLESLLKNLGFANATRACAGILLACSIPLAFFIKPRLPAAANTHRQPFNMRFATSRVFLVHQLANVVEATGYFLPAIYLPTYARAALGASSFLSALTVMLVNIAATVGLVMMGFLSDRLAVTTCMAILAAGVGASVLLVWGLTASLPVLYVFCVLYGLFAGSWSAIWPGIMRLMSQKGETAAYGPVDPVMVQGHLCVGRGVGNIISGPLSDSLIKGMPWQGKVMGGFGSGYGPLILYTGLTGLVSGTNFVWDKLHLL